MFKNYFTSAYADQIARKWELFQQNGSLQGVRPLIAESWRRCRALGVSVETIDHPSVSPESFRAVQHREAELTEVASAILDRIFATVHSFECLINLANAEGISLRTWKGSGKVFDVQEGTRISEESVGTAGMPLCLRVQEPVIVYCAEHYCRPHHEMVCVSSPVHDHAGKLLGGLTISCHRDIFHPWSFTLVTEAAKGIGEQLRLRAMLARENLLIESFSEGVLVVDGEGGLIRANTMAKAMLSITDEVSRPVEAFFPEFTWSGHIRSGTSFKNEEVRIGAGHGKFSRCILSFHPMQSGGMLTLKNIPEMYTYAARTAGIKAGYYFSDIVGQSRRLRDTVHKAQRFAASDLTVLILGESGTGKELFAQSIHNASSRHAEPFVVVNCGALPRGLVQSELFGYAEGAFTGARRQGNPGKFELADGGTLFLDEIGEMELEAQSSLLRFLQSGEVCRIGGRTSRRVDVRVLAATNRNIQAAIAEGRFREDLYHRLNVCALHIPPLRERVEDIPLLAQFFMRRMGEKYPQFLSHSFSREALAKMLDRPWPGNVRELEHFIEKLLFSVKDTIIRSEDIQDELPASLSCAASPPTSLSARGEEQGGEQDEKAVIINALIRCNGNVTRASQVLGIGKTSLYTRINLHGIIPKQFKKLGRH